MEGLLRSISGSDLTLKQKTLLEDRKWWDWAASPWEPCVGRIRVRLESGRPAGRLMGSSSEETQPEIR